MIKLPAIALASTALAACAAQPMNSPVVVVGPVVAVQPATVAAVTAPKPQYGTFGFDTAGMDRSVAPGDDFYGFANNRWAKTTPIPADKANYGAFNLLDDLSHTRTQDILVQAQADPNSRIGTAYGTYLDTAAIEAKGLTPINPWLTQIRGLKSKAEYPALLATARLNSVDAPVSAHVGQDDKDPESYVMNLSQSGLGMPDRDYYLSRDAKLVQAKAAYQQHLAAMLTLAGEPNAAARARAIIDFETKIAKVSWTNVESRDSD
ncbi:MAG: M13 family metallopeptidase N-terminal domain-containing protein, partial [Sphingomicrobium sp.]